MFKTRKANFDYIDKTDDIHAGAVWKYTVRKKNMGIVQHETKFCRIISVVNGMVAAILYTDMYGETIKKRMKIETLRKILLDKGYSFNEKKRHNSLKNYTKSWKKKNY